MAREEQLKEEEGDDDDDAPKVKEACAERKAADAAAAAAKAAKAAHAEFGVPRPMELRREIASLARRVYAAGSDRNKTRTLLCSVYHHALHGRYFEARDMLLTSHLGDAIHDRDIQTQILYNRAMARCGLCAFELQLLPEAHSALMELAGGSRLKEAANINRSLLVLGNVISELAAGNKKHVKYRDSKLTRLLSAALGGNSCTAIMAATSAAESELDESRTTLQFATRAMSVVNKVTKNVVVDGSALLDQYRSEIEKLKAELAEARRSSVSSGSCI